MISHRPLSPANPGQQFRHRPLVVAAVVVAAMTAMRIAYAALLDLRTDEAYYWTWSKEQVLCFLDHPPMIAWFIRAGTAVFGDTSLGARFGGIVAMLVTQLLLADIVRRVTRSTSAMVLALLLPEAALYYGLLMAKVAPDTAAIVFSVAMVWSLVRLAERGDGRWWLAAGAFGGLALLSKFTVVLMLPAVLAFWLVPAWRTRWLVSPWPWAGALLAFALFLPVVVWNVQHDFASFRFQLVRATAANDLSLRTLGDYVGLQFGLVGFVLLPVTLSALGFTAWRGYRTREPVAILLSTAVLVPFLYFLWKSLSLRIGDTWPMSIWPAAFAAIAINITMMPKEGWSIRLIRSTVMWARVAVVTGIAFVVVVFLYYTAAPFNLLGRMDPIGAEGGYRQVAAAAERELQATGATWIATSDYRTFAMMRWFFNGRVPVVQVNERARFIGFRDPGIAAIAGHPGIFVALEPDNSAPVWAATSAARQRLAQVERIWRGRLMDTYAIDKLTGWTPDLVPPPDSPLYRWRPLANLPDKLKFARNTAGPAAPDEGGY